jgi:hypothetical protein
VALVASLALLPGSTGLAASPAGSAFTYQGNLTDGGVPANGTFDFQFDLFDAVSGGNQIGATIVQTLPVSSALFTTELDFGTAPYTGRALWLQIGVRVSGTSAAFTLLSPRQPVTPTPYAVTALGAWSQNGNVGVGSGFLGTTDATPLRLEANNTPGLVVGPDGSVAVGTPAAPSIALAASTVSLMSASVEIVGAQAVTLDAARINIGTGNATAINIGRPGQTTAVGGALTVAAPLTAVGGLSTSVLAATGGTLDNVTIGNTTPAKANFTLLNTTLNATIGGTLVVVGDMQSRGRIGFFGVAPSGQLTLQPGDIGLTAGLALACSPNCASVVAVADANTANEVNNLRARVNQLESDLKSYGLLK